MSEATVSDSPEAPPPPVVSPPPSDSPPPQAAAKTASAKMAAAKNVRLTYILPTTYLPLVKFPRFMLYASMNCESYTMHFRSRTYYSTIPPRSSGAKKRFARSLSGEWLHHAEVALVEGGDARRREPRGESEEGSIRDAKFERTMLFRRFHRLGDGFRKPSHELCAG